MCYPDDFENGSTSLAAECLEAFRGTTLIHVGELFGDTPLLDMAPWGRTSGADFQQRLHAEFRCAAAAIPMRCRLSRGAHIRGEAWKARWNTCRSMHTPKCSRWQLEGCARLAVREHYIV